jgi:hypothetical protein
VQARQMTNIVCRLGIDSPRFFIGNHCLYRFGSNNRLPTIRRFANCKIAIYADDHMPPHFYIE